MAGCAIGAALLLSWSGVAAQALEPGRLEFNLAQQLPSTVDPGRIEQQFEEGTQPLSTFEPVVPEGEEATPPSGAEDIRFTLSGVMVEGATAFPESAFLPLYEELLGSEVSLAEVYRIAGKISALYRGRGYILSRAVVPAQHIRDGLVRVAVLEGFVNEVIVEGDVTGRESLLDSYAAKISAERPLSADTLERYLLLADDLPGVTAKAVLTPSVDVPGASDLVLFIDQKPIDQAYSFDNRGTRFVGPFTGSLSYKFNNLMGLYEQSTFRFIAATQTEELRLFQLTHQETVGSEGTKVQLSYTFTRSKPGFTFDAATGTNVEADSQVLTLSVKHPLIRSRSQNLTLKGEFTYFKSVTDLAFKALFEDRLRIIRGGASYDFVDKFRGINLLEFEVSQGLDILHASESGSADNVAPDISRVNGKSDFFKVTGDISRLQQLFPGVSLLAAATGQFSGSQLLSSEEFGFGGANFGRAFDSSEITGEHGAAGKLELQYGRTAESVPFLRELPIKDFQLYTFYDYGYTFRIDPVANGVADGKHHQTGSSAGVGVRFNLGDNVSGFMELDKPLTRPVAARGTDGNEARAFFAIAARF